MGFQFNHVGGGTKTRRPITLHMKYNSGCVQPTCYLMLEDVGEQEVSLEELQVSLCPSTSNPAGVWASRAHWLSLAVLASGVCQMCHHASLIFHTAAVAVKALQCHDLQVYSNMLFI